MIVYCLCPGLSPSIWDASLTETPLHSAGRCCRPASGAQVVSLLLSHGGNVNIGMDTEAGDPLTTAVRQNNVNMTQTLVDNNAKVTT